MKARSFQNLGLWLVVAVSLAWARFPADAAQAKPAAPASATAAKTNSIAALTEQNFPKSVFVQPSNAKEGRDPFFPESVQAAPVPDKNHAPRIDTSNIVLNGITPEGPRTTAMINGRTFEPGESGEIKLSNGSKLLIKCEEISSDSVVIIVNGQRRELHMRFGL